MNERSGGRASRVPHSLNQYRPGGIVEQLADAGSLVTVESLRDYAAGYKDRAVSKGEAGNKEDTALDGTAVYCPVQLLAAEGVGFR